MKKAKNRLVLRLSTSDQALLRRLLAVTTFARNSEIIKAALYHFWQFWEIKQAGARIVLSNVEKRHSFTLHLDRVTVAAADDMFVSEQKSTSMELALSEEETTIIQNLLRIGAAPTKSQIVREALLLYNFLVEYVLQDWQSAFRSEEDIPFVLRGLADRGARTSYEEETVPNPAKEPTGNMFAGDAMPSADSKTGKRDKTPVRRTSNVVEMRPAVRLKRDRLKPGLEENTGIRSFRAEGSEEVEYGIPR
jgi:hypothetical protein